MQMRRYQQREILGLVDTIYEANNELRKFMSRNEVANIVQLLMDMKEFVMGIIDFVGLVEEYEVNTIKYLKDYYGMLSEIVIHIENKISYMDIYKSSLRKIDEIKNSALADIVIDKIEVVFLPYKASMWDSMESIWEEAKLDPSCEIYVVPIPYYEMIQGKASGALQCERGLYPEYVSTTDWREYDIEKRHPDIIYIHNPYDEINLITQVHPAFFSKRIRAYTDLLVYVPYFVSVGDVAKHLCVTPGTLYADVVMVQSEQIRKTYITEFQEFEKKNNCVGKFGDVNLKFIALGSPKFDKVLMMKNRNVVIPTEWNKHIVSKNGTRKKVILYNTSISTVLEESEKLVRKIKQVIKCFSGHNDVILLWRPHPLNALACAAMRPNILAEYLALVEEFKNSGNGIYDDTADVHNSIAISDAYFGDGGSLLALYQCTGKPIMVQNIDWDTADKRFQNLAFENIHVMENDIWFTAYNYNALFKMDRSSWQTEYVGSFPNEKQDGWRLYASILEHDEKLVFVPSAAEEIAEYNINKKTFKKTRIMEPENTLVDKYKPEAKFYAAAKYKNYIFFIACSYPAFIRYDVNSGKIDYYTDWVEELNGLNEDSKDVYFRQAACVVDSCFIVASCSANAFVQFDMENCISKVFRVGNKDARYSGICHDGKDFWGAPRNEGPIVRWNRETNTFKEYNNFPKGYTKCKYSFWSTCFAGGFVWLFPNQANMALRIDPTNEKIEIATGLQEKLEAVIENKGQYSENYLMGQSKDNIIYAHTGKGNEFIEYDINNQKMKSEGIKLSEVDSRKTLQQRTVFRNITSDLLEGENHNAFSEGPSALLTDFILYVTIGLLARDKSAEEDICVRNKTVSACNDNKSSSGSQIYSFCRSQL